VVQNNIYRKLMTARGEMQFDELTSPDFERWMVSRGCGTRGNFCRDPVIHPFNPSLVW
jgi:hypothetical protein